MKFKFKDYLFFWLQVNRPTIDGKIYKIKNPISIFLKKNGVIKLSDDCKIPYNRDNREDVFILVAYALLNGIKFTGKVGWKYDSKNELVEMHQGIKLKIKGLRLIDETFLYQIHFNGFDLKDKVVITAGAFIGDTPLFYSFYGAKVYGSEILNSFNIVEILTDLTNTVFLSFLKIEEPDEPLTLNGKSISSSLPRA